MSHQLFRMRSYLTPSVLAFFLFSFLFGAATEPGLTAHFSRSDILQGERYFKGLLPIDRKAPSCASCHYYLSGDTMNWNPSAIEIAQLYKDKTIDELTEVLSNPSGKVMMVAHAEIDIPTDQFVFLKAYLDNLSETGTPKAKPSVLQIILFLFLGAILTWALLDLIVFHKVKWKLIPVLVFISAFGYQLFMVYEAAVNLGRSKNYQPDQPIKFSHKVHAGDNKIDCMYCHFTANESKSANIPSTELCMNCHMVVREGSRSGKFEINKLVKAYDENRSIEWIRVHKLPDHVFFAHAQHVGVGKLDCTQCHGQVDEMDILKQENDLSMGWCLECHRTTNVNFGNAYYDSIFQKHHNEIKEGLRDSIPASELGANECAKCHY